MSQRLKQDCERRSYDGDCERRSYENVTDITLRGNRALRFSGFFKNNFFELPSGSVCLTIPSFTPPFEHPIAIKTLAYFHQGAGVGITGGYAKDKYSVKIRLAGSPEARQKAESALVKITRDDLQARD